MNSEPQTATLHSPKLLHLGCGALDVRRGWINVDLKLEDAAWPDGTRTLQADVRDGIPVGSFEIDLVYSSHFFEHLTTEEGHRVLLECHRVLKPRGVFRAALPTHHLLLAAYVNRDTAYLDRCAVLAKRNLPPPLLRTPIDFITRELQTWGHKSLYDPEKIERMLHQAGFCGFQQVTFDPHYDPAGEVRRSFSFYVEARKPALTLDVLSA